VEFLPDGDEDRRVTGEAMRRRARRNHTLAIEGEKTLAELARIFDATSDLPRASMSAMVAS
jgi:hypothetical protein